MKLTEKKCGKTFKHSAIIRYWVWGAEKAIEVAIGVR